jgi:predicted amidohydrolase
VAERLRVALFQFAPRLGEREANLETIETGLARVEAELVVLPELATSG